MLASILTAAAAQLASTFDAIIVAHFVGEEAVSALSLVMPVTTFISCLGLLMAFGANALAAREIGSHNLEGASDFFSTAVWSILTIGVAFSMLMYAGIPVIMEIITDEESLRTLPTDYLSVYVLGAWLEMLSYAFCLFVATDGHPRKVTMAVFAGVLVNAFVDLLAVGFLDWGIKGAAWGSLAQFAVNILLLTLYIRQPICSYSLKWPKRKNIQFFLENIKEGAAVSISNILMAVTVLLLCNIIFNALGERGLFFWSVCLQMLLISVVFINGIIESLFAIGGILLGEHDTRGLDLLARRALLAVFVLMIPMIVLMCVPGVVGVMFGIKNDNEMADLNHVLRIYSLALLPFALTLITVATYQMLERILLCVCVVVGQLSVTILVVGALAYYAPAYIWWGFPLAGFSFLAVQLLYSYIYSHRQKCRVSALTLIPYSEGGRRFDSSVRYRSDEVYSVLNDIDAFLQESKLSEHDIFCLNLCCEELMTNIAKHSHGHIVHHSFDVHIYTDDESTCVALKDGGKPFNPLLADKMADPDIGKEGSEHLGLRLVNTIVENISYKYMYGLNIVLIKI
ncbi:MAG: ATP-binding protein [Prevotella sp.]|nr:ATP-binding protein [Prevotella sp.]